MNDDTIQTTDAPDRPVLFFDGECVMCNGIVDLLLKIDRARVFRFASLQGETAAHLRRARQDFPDELDSFVLWDGQQAHLRSQGVFETARLLGFPWNIGALVAVLPRRMTDAFYRWIARNRFQWFGRRDACRLPSTEEAELFLE